MKRSTLLLITGTLVGVVLLPQFTSCKPSEAIANKSGAVLWSENCQRCHNLPAPTMYSDDQWKAIITHMQVRANITKVEAEKISAFLQASN